MAFVLCYVLLKHWDAPHALGGSPGVFPVAAPRLGNERSAGIVC